MNEAQPPPPQPSPQVGGSRKRVEALLAIYGASISIPGGRPPACWSIGPTSKAVGTPAPQGGPQPELELFGKERSLAAPAA